MYHHVFVAGTFDRLHHGHKALLRSAFEMGEKVTVGITSDKFVNEYKKKLTADSYQPSAINIALCTKRRSEVEVWLKTQGYSDRASFVYIHTPYEPATSVSRVDALVVTNQNRKTGEEINEKRKIKNLPPFHLIEVDLVPAEDTAPISSTRIRAGSIDCDGNLVMPESLRALLGKPLGKVLTGSDILASIKNHETSVIITVGDMATKTVVDFGVVPHVAIMDNAVERRVYRQSADVINSLEENGSIRADVASGPGYMSKAAINAVSKAVLLKENSIIVVNGEEDLLALPVIVHATLGSIVYYGQPGRGLVEVIISQAVKNEVQKLLQKFIH
ncbi:pantetheine-phosphate adenylyltransferase [Candidatus Gottesmanbacteria bacterium]|nr:pantetheine-phosphate adenylyltransferase [Candidatus Gottesmanbacteria bacterium]